MHSILCLVQFSGKPRQKILALSVQYPSPQRDLQSSRFCLRWQCHTAFYLPEDVWGLTIDLTVVGIGKTTTEFTSPRPPLMTPPKPTWGKL